MYKKMKTIEIILGFFKSKGFTRFLWTSLDGFLALGVTYLTSIDVWWSLPLIGIFQFITKTIYNKVKK